VDRAQASLQDALRPASLLRDLHPLAAWAQAAERLHAAAAAALAALHGSAAVQRQLRRTLAQLQGEGSPGAGRQQQRRLLLLRGCELLLPAFERQRRAARGARQRRQRRPGAAPAAAEAPALRLCLAAYHNLATRPQLAPALVVTQGQLQLLAAGAAGTPLTLLQALPSGLDLSLELHPGHSITVPGYCTWTEEAWEAAAAAAAAGGGLGGSLDSGGGLAALALTVPLLAALLQHHPHSGARAQLHAAGLLPRRAALLAALDQLVALRQAGAAGSGARSHAHLALQVRGGLADGCLADGSRPAARSRALPLPRARGVAGKVC
jgi:hypothetical protein